MASFMERKKMKATKKYTNILFKDMRIKVSSDPKRDLAICNAGILTGLNEEDVVHSFSQFGQIELVVMVPNKSYCFISFKNLSSAVECFSSANANKEILPVKGPLHVLYVEEVPSKQELYDNFMFKPSGIFLIEDFISEAEEAALIEKFDFVDESEVQMLNHRKVRHYGFEFKYGTNNVNKEEPLKEPIPEEFNFLIERLKDKGFSDLIPWSADQLTINYYLPGQGIPPHVDTHSAFEDPILSLSLLSDVVMDFVKCDKQRKSSLLLPKRSLLIMSGEARYFWTHGITPKKSDITYSASSGLKIKSRGRRISFTFRKVRKGECSCNYTIACDSYLKRNAQPPSDKVAARIENEYVHKVYESISDHFSLTRHSPWPAVNDFLVSLPTGAVVVDVGCGNGKYFQSNGRVFHFGGDSSFKLNMICNNKGMQVIQFNCLNVPLKNDIADAVICIAVIHHLSNRSRRVQALKEIYRILKKGGTALVYVWSKEQKSTSYVKKKENNVNYEDTTPSLTNYTDESGVILPIHDNKKEFQHKDVLVPWNIRMKNQENTQHLRYYHLFEKTELEEMFKEIGAHIIRTYYDDGNWCALFSK